MEFISSGLIKEKANTKALKFIVFAMLVVLFMGINNTCVYYKDLMPFGASMVFCFMYVSFNGYIVSLLYALTYLFFNWGFESLVVVGCVVFFACLYQYLIGSKKMKNTKLTISIFLLLSLLGFVFAGVEDMKEGLAVFVSVVLSAFFMYSAIIFFDALFVRGKRVNLSLDERICGAVVLLVFVIGISSANISFVSVGLFFSVLFILLSVRMCKYSVSFCISSLIGCGYAISFGDVGYISLFIVLALVSVAFKYDNGIMSSVACVLGYLAYVFLFDVGFVLGNFISVLVGAVATLLIPNKYIGYIVNTICSVDDYSLSVINEHGRREVVDRINYLSDVFLEMNAVYSDMVRGVLVDDKAKELIGEEVIVSVCSKCTNKDSCLKNTSSYMPIALKEFVDCAYEKKKACLVDIPEYMSVNCLRLNQMIMTIGNLINTYVDYSSAISNIDTSRMLIADQLSGVSGLLKNLAKEVSVNMKHNATLGKMLGEKINNIGVCCLDCSVYEKGVCGMIVTTIVKNYNNNDNILLKIVNKTLKTKLRICKTKEGRIPNTKTIIMESCPNYDIAFGSANINKTGKVVSGDSYMITKIGGGKYLASICDGMGSGSNAKDISSLTLKLIESFYRAGFDNEIILNSINKLLSLTENDDFSTIDMCIIDGKQNTYDFVKLGATNGFLKRFNGIVEVIESSGLPIGILENIRPHITSKYIEPMDMIVLVSDGVTDILRDDIIELLKQTDIVNPQLLSEQILSYAIDKSGGCASDDMTVLCIRVFECV